MANDDSLKADPKQRPSLFGKVVAAAGNDFHPRRTGAARGAYSIVG